MGYRSDVVIAIKKEEIVNFNLHLAQAGISDYEDLLDFLSEAQQTDLDPNDGRVVYEWRGIKWYLSNNTWFKAIEDALRELPSQSYGFMRIGEEIEDIEISGDHWELGITLVRDFKF